MKGARGILINITGGMDMTLFEVDAAANRIREAVDEKANIIFGSMRIVLVELGYLF
ncbi:Cell division protein FtsZ [Anaplasma phagocytophilum]|nr:Cell division protein FtsZ [Anaplasma phagocytophilum]SCV64627.1 Cell division protein FtsZ [Anaplasma phagocytophilum]SCV65826.1 Cell division protein FtsZ [Anaplasma phagocytophilum]